MRYRIALLALTVALILGCNDGNRGKSFPAAYSASAGSLRIYYATSFTADERLLLTSAIQAQVQAFQQTVAPTVQLTYNTPFPSAARDVYVYDVSYLNAPWALAQEGWTDLDKGYRINVVGGHCQLVPDLLHQLTHSYYFPSDIYHQKYAAIWTTVAQVKSTTLAQLKVQRFCPH